MITVGNGTVNDQPSGIAIDERTDTVYVSNFGDNTFLVGDQTPATGAASSAAADMTGTFELAQEI
jgi:DNA-binding beta-propeller fold protein YncE